MRAWVLLFSIGCSEPKLSPEALMDPQTCQSCHPDHYREWSGSMHAYAAEDPVFLAMNAKGQRETGGALGDFCVQCHAPLAVRQGLTTDGLNLDRIPKHLQGVNCYFCHNVIGANGDHNNPLRLADDDTMRGGIADPVESAAHRSEYSPLHDRARPESSRLCGPCHDIVTPKGVHIERTFSEWSASLYAHNTTAELQTCQRCHMQGREGLAAQADGVYLRRVTNHEFAGVDVALTPFPEIEAQRRAVQRFLDPTVFPQLCVTRVPNGIQITVDLENLAAGHHFPSGASADRRVWLELIATLGERFVFSTGVVPDSVAATEIEAQDPNFWMLSEKHFDDQGQITHSFWEVARYESRSLIAPTAIQPWDPEYRDPHQIRSFAVDGVADRVRMRLRLRPIGLEILDELIASGDLDPAIRAQMPTFDLAGTVVEWSPDLGVTCVPEI